MQIAAWTFYFQLRGRAESERSCEKRGNRCQVMALSLITRPVSGQLRAALRPLRPCIIMWDRVILWMCARRSGSREFNFFKRDFRCWPLLQSAFYWDRAVSAVGPPDSNCLRRRDVLDFVRDASGVLHFSLPGHCLTAVAGLCNLKNII